MQRELRRSEYKIYRIINTELLYLYFIYSINKAFCVKIQRVGKGKPSELLKSKNKRSTNIKLREKLRAHIPNNRNKALLLEKVNRDAQ